MPVIMSPGLGPNGPGPIDMRIPVTSVGQGSSVPYGNRISPMESYYNQNGVTGFVGPAAGSLQRPSSWYVRTGGSNNNGGSSASTTPDRSGVDGGTTTSDCTFTSASGAFTPADIGKGICVQTAPFQYAKILAINSTTSVRLSNPAPSTGSGRSWAIGGAWATLAPYLDSNSFAASNCGVHPGDTIYVGSGTYRATTHTLGGNLGRLYGPTTAILSDFIRVSNGIVNITGDVTGTATGDPPGPVIVSAYATNDKTVPSASRLFDFTTTGRAPIRFSNLFFMGGTNVTFNLGTFTQNVAFVDCAFQSILTATSSREAFSTSVSVGPLPVGLLIDRCHFMTTGAPVFTLICATSPHGGDYSLDIVIRDSVFVSGSTTKMSLSTGGTATGKPGGIQILGCTSLSSGGSFAFTSTGFSTTLPILIYGCVMSCGSGTAISSGTAGQMIEDYNIIQAATARSNVAVGAHTNADSAYALLVHFGQERIWGAFPRAYGEPLPGSPLLGFVSNDGSAFSRERVDLLQRPRPAGGAALPYPAVGALDRGNTWGKETGTVRTGTNALSITGPGTQDFSLAVDAVLTTLTIYMRYDSSYVGASKPHFHVLNGGQCGVADAASNEVVAVNSWEQLTLAFTPTSAGIVTVRLVSSDVSGVGKAFADDFAVT